MIANKTKDPYISANKPKWTWYWADGSSRNWTYWAGTGSGGEPSEGTIDKCMISQGVILVSDCIYTTRWYDGMCTWNFHYICKTPAAGKYVL